MIKLTYFTPTYNREKLLPQLYKSLCEQTNKSFVWMVIDDGSTDGTEELIKSYISENEIEIEYHKKPNGGKHTAIDLSNKLCRTEYISCIDSDDFLSANATEILLEYIEKYEEEKSVGFVGRRGHYDGRPFSEKWTNESQLLYFKDLNNKYGYSEDTILVFKTEIIKKFSFPVFNDERFVTESVFYNQFMRNYKIRTIDEIIYLSEYQEGGYTSQGEDLFFKNPKGKLYFLKQIAHYSIEDNESFRMKVYNSSMFYAWARALHIKDSFKKDYKIKFPYNILGRIGQLKLINKIKLQYNEYLQRRKK